MRPLYKIALLIGFLIILHAIFLGVYYYYMPQKDLTTAKPDFTITADDLGKEFTSDEAAASAKYNGKTIDLTGRIQNADAQNGKVITLTLKTSGQNSAVICNLAQPVDLNTIKADQEIRIRGEVSGYLMDVLLNNCIIIR
jgi:hypothetical protein